MNGKKAKAVRRQEKADELARKEWREYLRRGLTRPATTMTLGDLNKANAKVQEIAQAEEQLPAKEDWVLDDIGARTGEISDSKGCNLYNRVPKEIRAAIIISEPLPITENTQEGLEQSIMLADQRRTINFKPAVNVPGYETPERTFCLCTNCYVTLSFEVMDIDPNTCPECKEVEFDSTKDLSHLAESFQPSEAQLVLREVKAFNDKCKREEFDANFFFCPVDTTGLEKLTEDQRIELLENQGNYMVGLQKSDPMLRGDLICACENGRIPTHRKLGAKIPAYGNVPFDFSNLK